MRGRVLAGIGSDPDNPISDEVAPCLAFNISDEQVDELFALGFTDDGSADTQARADEVLATAIDACS
ncbi:hypothetical protein BH20ACT2_BH20ACT2_17380 [soil metagenome]